MLRVVREHIARAPSSHKANTLAHATLTTLRCAIQGAAAIRHAQTQACAGTIQRASLSVLAVDQITLSPALVTMGTARRQTTAPTACPTAEPPMGQITSRLSAIQAIGRQRQFPSLGRAARGWTSRTRECSPYRAHSLPQQRPCELLT